jgi:hypothetical protein
MWRKRWRFTPDSRTARVRYKPCLLRHFRHRHPRRRHLRLPRLRRQSIFTCISMDSPPQSFNRHRHQSITGRFLIGIVRVHRAAVRLIRRLSPLDPAVCVVGRSSYTYLRFLLRRQTRRNPRVPPFRMIYRFWQQSCQTKRGTVG